MKNMMEFRINMFCASFQQIMNAHGSCASLFVLINFLLLVFLHINMLLLLEMLRGKVYAVTKRVQPRFVPFDSIDVCPINSHCSRCFSIPFHDEFMNVTSYSCALAHN